MEQENRKLNNEELKSKIINLQVEELNCGKERIRQITQEIMDLYSTYGEECTDILLEQFVICLSDYFKDDEDLKLYLGIAKEDLDMIKNALNNGADPGVNPWEKYKKNGVVISKFFIQWRHLFICTNVKINK